MKNMDDVPFFGKGFNKIYPLIMVIYTLLIVSNFFDRVIEYFGNWKIFKLQREANDTYGFDPSGMIILQRERSWLEHGHKIGELIVPLARNFNNTNVDLESASSGKAAIDMKGKTGLLEDRQTDYLELLKAEARNETTRESMGKKYATLRAQQTKQEINATIGRPSSTTSISETSDIVENPGPGPGPEPEPEPAASSGITSSTWESMKTGFQNLKTNMGGAKKFLPLRQVQDHAISSGSSSESLDEIFQRLRRPTLEHRNFDDDIDEDPLDIQHVMAGKKTSSPEK